MMMDAASLVFDVHGMMLRTLSARLVIDTIKGLRLLLLIATEKD